MKRSPEQHAGARTQRQDPTRASVSDLIDRFKVETKRIETLGKLARQLEDNGVEREGEVMQDKDGNIMRPKRRVKRVVIEGEEEDLVKMKANAKDDEIRELRERLQELLNPPKPRTFPMKIMPDGSMCPEFSSHMGRLRSQLEQEQ